MSIRIGSVAVSADGYTSRSFEAVGYKFGAWHDVAWYGMRCIEPTDPPCDPIPLPNLM